MKLIPEQIDWYLNQIKSGEGLAKRASEAQKELSRVERYRSTSSGDQDCATAAEQTLYEQAIYYDHQTGEYKNALANVSLPKPDVNSDVAEIGSYVTVVDTISYDGQVTTRTQDILLIEGELGNRSALDIKCASDSSAMGKALLGAWPGEVVEFKVKVKNSVRTHSCEVVAVDNNYIYQRYAEHYDKDTLDLDGQSFLR